MNIYVGVGCFVLFYTVNTMNNLPIFVRPQDTPVNTLLIFTFLSNLILIITYSFKWGNKFNLAFIRATWYPSNINIIKNQHKFSPYIIKQNKQFLKNMFCHCTNNPINPNLQLEPNILPFKQLQDQQKPKSRSLSTPQAVRR